VLLDRDGIFFSYARLPDCGAQFSQSSTETQRPRPIRGAKYWAKVEYNPDYCARLLVQYCTVHQRKRRSAIAVIIRPQAYLMEEIASPSPPRYDPPFYIRVRRHPSQIYLPRRRLLI
jgi:hypothetical protein